MNFFNFILQDISRFSFQEIYQAFFTLFVAIDIIGAIPVILSLKAKGQRIYSGRVATYSLIMLLIFLFIGKSVLTQFDVDDNSFSIAGAIVLFVLAVEMIFGIEVFKDDGPSGSSTFVPLVFPLFAGAASFTVLLTLRANGFAYINITICVFANILVVYLVLKYVYLLEKVLGQGGIYILRKFFGVILLAISIKFFTDNFLKLLDRINSNNEKNAKKEAIDHMISRTLSQPHYQFAEYFAKSQQA